MNEEISKEFNKYRVLTNALLKNSFSSMRTSAQQSKKSLKIFKKNDGLLENSNIKTNNKVKETVSIILTYLFIFVFMGFMGYTLASFVKKDIDPKLFYYLVFIIAEFMLLLMGGPIFIGQIYSSKNDSLLMSLPVKSRTIFLSKFTSAYLSMLVFAFNIVIPLLIVGTIRMHVVNKLSIGLTNYIFIIIAPFAVSLVPSFILTIMSLPIMKISRLFKKNNVIRIILVFLFISIVVTVQILFSTIGNSQGNGEDLGEINPALLILCKISIYHHALVNIICGVGLGINFIYLFAELMGIFFAILLLSALFYKSNSYFMIENRKEKNYSNKSNVKNSNSKLLKSGKILNISQKLIIKNTVKEYTNNSILLFQFINLVIVPIIIIISNFFIIRKNAQTDGFDIWYVMLPLFFICNYSPIGSFSFGNIMLSREGKNSYIYKSLPITFKEFINAKLAISFIISMIIGSLYFLMYLFVSNWKISIFLFVYMIFSFVTTFHGFIFGLLSDAKNPVINWDGVHSLIKIKKKSSLKGIIYVMFSLILSTIFIIVIVFEKNKLIADIINSLVLMAFNIILFVHIKFLLDKVYAVGWDNID